ncbi:MAG: hypothetical protein L0219_07375 [Phycisphaerales bacterium]|nr:hypothetical protein [Phycisphaerales bacterium]
MTNTPFVSHNIVVKVDDETSAPINISGNANMVEWGPNFRTESFVAFGEAWDNSNDGGKSWSAKLRIYVSKDATEAFRDILQSWKNTRGARTCEFDYPDGAVGSLSATGDGRLDGDVKITADRENDKVMVCEFNVRGHGALTEAVIV